MTALYIQAEGAGPAWQVWPAPDAIPAGTIREGATYLFELRDCADAAMADLLIDDSPIEALRSRDVRSARWRWQPGFHAGVVEVMLLAPGNGVRRFQVTTDPDVRKLTREDFDAMVREILEDSFALFSLSAFRKGIARQQGTHPPPFARLEFLRSRADEIVKAVEAIARVPRHYLQAREMVVPAHRARNATAPEIIRSFRSGVIRRESVTPPRLPSSLQGCLPAQILLRRRLSSVDITEHRQIKGCLRYWSRWLQNVAEKLASARESDDSELKTTATTWAARARRIARSLEQASTQGFMAEVTEGPAALLMSSLFRSDPVYRRFYRLWQDMNLGLASVFGDFLQIPLAKTYDLYERWCFLRLLRAAVDEYGVKGLNVSALFLGDGRGGVTIPNGAITVPIGGDRVLCFQRQYREYWIEESGEGSFSRTMVPDVVMAGSNLGGPGRTVIVLDAKYRINNGLNDALSSIHTYRDALVHEANTGEIEGIVTAAYLLTPHLPATLAPDFKSTPIPGRLFHPGYRERFRFGAVTLRPGMSAAELRSCLRTIVADT